ncbi:hypothetical protein [Crateriforma conspicua]|uniref:Uncharacterized protein n=1 Tax=Crateriforma conspicua TaxID=2527996 RepID=A0A5C5Y749_9PLAN|nr:hypothetical protein [Crateriforma conspicua]TWT71497.1 hypothetical protein Pan14r_38070 [Crateriforma conspicua]
MGTLKLKPNAEQLGQLLLCAEIDENKLAGLVSHLAELASPPLVPDGLLKEFGKQLGSLEQSETLLGQVLSLSMLVRDSDSKPVEVVRALRAAMESEEDKQTWDTIAASFQALMESAPVRLVTKAMELSYDYSNLLRGARILTDLRPLFDEDGAEVEGAVVTHTLRFEYSSDDGRHELSIAMDLSDIERLRDQCDRSIVKAKTIRDRFVKDTRRPCLISGETEKQND